MKITMNTLDGVTLKTKNKYVNEDIAVAVSDEAINEKLTEITIDKDGTYEPTDDSIGFSKVVVDTNKPKQVAQITIPEQGNWLQKEGIFNFDIDEEWALLSGNSVLNNGLWLCNKLTGDNTQLINSGSFANFYQIKDRIVIPSNYSSTPGVWVYYHNTKTAERRYDIGYGANSNPAVINNDVFIYRSTFGLIKYNYDEDVITDILFNNATLSNLGGFYSYKNKLIFKREDTTNGYGFYIYDNDTQTVRLILETYITSIQTKITNNGYFATYRDKEDTSLYYFAKFDEETESFIFTNTQAQFSFGSNYYLDNENGSLFWSGSSQFKGAWWYDVKDKTLEKAIDVQSYQYDANKCKVLDNYMFLAGASTSTNPGWILFNTEDKTWINPVTEGATYAAVKEGKYIFIAPTSSSSKGLYLYNTETRETKPLNSAAYWTYPGLVACKDRILLSCNFIFYTSDETVKSLTTGSFRKYKVDEDYVYWTTSGSDNSGTVNCYIYNDDKIYASSSSQYDIIELINGVCYASSTVASRPETIRFDKNRKVWVYASIYKGEI